MRVGPVSGFYVQPTRTTTNDSGKVLLFYYRGRLVEVGASGTVDDRATSERIGSIILHRL
jgi:hypothetical protein